MPGISPTYRIGPSDVFTSDDLLADANILNGQMNSLDSQNWDRPSQATFDGWNAFLQDWRAFYRSTFFNFLGAGWNNGNRDELIQFETRFATFAASYQRESGNALPGGVVAPSTGSKATLAQHLLDQLQPLVPAVSIGIVLAVVLGLAGAWVYYRYIRPRFMKGGA